ncbi:hypothetical protein QLX67_11075 [Balneolaceae bacterium ANBcel3]|nr:hypothetical protein [Balneolaceae bacterium ANBcel3]
MVHNGRFLLLFLILTTFSCGIFSTRDPEEPGTTSGSVFIPPDRATTVITNLKNAVRSMNSDHYLRSLSSDHFTFEPTADAQSRNSSLWNQWGYIDESQYFGNLSSQTANRSGHELVLENESYLSIDQTEQFEAIYRLKINHGESGIPEEATGRMILILEQDESGDWFIRSWADFENGSSFTWSDLRYSFYN